MKIKLRLLVDSFKAIHGIYDSITTFSRVVSLADSYSEIKNIVALFEARKMKLVPKADEDGNISVKDYNELNAKIDSMLEEEVELKYIMKFTKQECADALKNKLIKGSDFAAIHHYFVRS